MPSGSDAEMRPVQHSAPQGEAPPPQRPTRGGDQSGLRAYNRRMILSTIRQHGPLPKADLARLTGLTAQTASVIVNLLLKEKLVRKETKIRGRVGQPRTPIALNPEGALAIGIKIGRRSLEIVLVDFLGEIVSEQQFRYSAPRPSEVMALLERHLETPLSGLSEKLRERIVGVGIAAPGYLSEWAEVMSLGPSELSDWRDFDISASVQRLTDLPVELWNDATAACAAEVLLGDAMTFSSALYVYIGSFIGGGLVLDGRLYEGVRRNAGAVGPMPVLARSGDGLEQLIRSGSLIHLDRMLAEAGFDGEAGILEKVRQASDHPTYLAWRRQAAKGIANAIACAMSVIDLEGVVVDAMLDPEDVAGITAEVGEALAEFDLTGLSPVTLRAGTIGPSARALGAAILPFIRGFSPDRQLLVKQTPAAA